MQNKVVLHISHTDINVDSRILKEMKVAYDAGATVYGIGISERKQNTSPSHGSEEFSIESIVLSSRKMTFLPAVVRHIFSLIEFYIKTLVRAGKIKPDLIHCNDILALPIGVLIKLIKGSKLVYDAHELESNKNGQSRFEGGLVLFIEKRLWRFVDALLVVSPSIDTWYQQNIGKKQTLVVLNSPLIEKHSRVDSSYLRHKFGIAEDKKIFIYVGMVMSGRGIELIVDAFKKGNTNAALVVLGNGEMLDALKRKSVSAQNIFFHERVPHEQVVEVAKSADFGLCLIENISLSDFYSLPNKLFEYIFAEVPVLASNFPDISFLVNKHNLGLCVELDAESISQAMTKICDDELKFSINTKSLEAYGWDAQANKLKALYARVLEN